MGQSMHRTSQLPDAVLRAAMKLLGTGQPADRRAAAQLLARGYADHEDERVAAIPVADRGDGYDERTEE